MIITLLRFLLILAVLWIGLRLWRGFKAKMANKPPAAKPKLDNTVSLLQCPMCHEYRADQGKGCSNPNCAMRAQQQQGKGSGFTSILVWAGLMAALVLGGPAQALAQSAEVGGRYMVSLSGRNVQAILYVNDIPVNRWQLGAQVGEAGGSLNHWLKAGRNVIRFEIVATTKNSATSEVNARVYYLGLGGVSDAAPTVVDLLRVDRLPAAGSAPQVSFNVAKAPILALWQVTDRLSLAQLQDDTVQGQIFARLLALRDQVVKAVQDGQGDEAVADFAAERRDMALAYGAPALSVAVGGQPVAEGAVASAAVTSHTGNVTAAQDKVAVGFVADAGKLALSLPSSAADAGLVLAARADGKPLLVAQKGGQQIIVQAVLLSRQNGQWQIVRRLN
jgi:hypothetical protein